MGRKWTAWDHKRAAKRRAKRSQREGLRMGTSCASCGEPTSAVDGYQLRTVDETGWRVTRYLCRRCG